MASLSCLGLLEGWTQLGLLSGTLASGVFSLAGSESWTTLHGASRVPETVF